MLSLTKPVTPVRLQVTWTCTGLCYLVAAKTRFTRVTSLCNVYL